MFCLTFDGTQGSEVRETTYTCSFLLQLSRKWMGPPTLRSRRPPKLRHDQRPVLGLRRRRRPRPSTSPQALVVSERRTSTPDTLNPMNFFTVRQRDTVVLVNTKLKVIDLWGPTDIAVCLSVCFCSPFIFPLRVLTKFLITLRLCKVVL